MAWREESNSIWTLNFYSNSNPFELKFKPTNFLIQKNIRCGCETTFGYEKNSRKKFFAWRNRGCRERRCKGFEFKLISHPIRFLTQPN